MLSKNNPIQRNQLEMVALVQPMVKQVIEIVGKPLAVAPLEGY